MAPHPAPDLTTPHLSLDLGAVEASYRRLAAALDPAQIAYAMKCNPHESILRRLAAAGSRFEIASIGELQRLERIGVDPADVLFSNPVKVASHIAASAAAGLWRYAFDSIDELDKLARNAPGAAVYVRLGIDGPTSGVASEGKFGVGGDVASDLLLRAKDAGLRPYGVAFHVGSQMLDLGAWDAPLRRTGKIMRDLLEHDIVLDMVDVGGGFPARYTTDVPELDAYGDAIRRSVKEHLPYGIDLVAEPGRAMVAGAGTLVAMVIGVAERFGKKWVHLDIGAFNGMMESLETQNQLLFPLQDSRASARTERCNVTGPSCDSQDTLFFDVELSADIATGDLVRIGTAGAYTTSYASEFNDFPVPATIAR